MDTAAWNKERERLERAAVEAIERLRKHAGDVESIVLRLPDGAVAAIGERKHLARTLSHEHHWTPYTGDN